MAEKSFWENVGALFGRKEAVNSSLELFKQIYGGRESKSGVAITAERALGVATVLACCRVLAEGVSQVPLRLYQDVNGYKAPATKHPLYRLLYRAPNAQQTSFEFRETLMFHLVLTGNAFVFLNRVGSKREIRELIPIEPGRVQVDRKNYVMTYKVRGDDGSYQEIPAEAIWHMRGPSWNGWMGLEAVRYARDSIGLAISLEDDQADFHKNGAQTSGLLSTEGTMKEERYKFLTEWLDQYAPGGKRHSKPMLLDSGAKFTAMRMTGVDAQTLESRKHQIEELCRVFRVMPIMVGHAGDQSPTFASAEQFFLNHVVHTLSPWYERIEHSADVNLLSEADVEAGFYTKFNAQALMRGASTDRSNYYSKALGSGGTKGWMTQNEVRALEEQNRIDDPEADKLPQATTAKPDPAPEPDPKGS